jgi:hypothetical protein
MHIAAMAAISERAMGLLFKLLEIILGLPYSLFPLSSVIVVRVRGIRRRDKRQPTEHCHRGQNRAGQAAQPLPWICHGAFP